MKVSLGKITLAAIMLTAVSCSGYNKLLKSTEHEAKYNKAIEYYENNKLSKAIQLLSDIAPVYQNTQKEDSIWFFLGASLYRQGDFVNSEEMFNEFRQRFGRSPFLEEAEYMYAKGFYFMSPVPERDQASTIKAMRAIQEYLDRYPGSLKRDALELNLEELQQKLYDKAFLNARLYYDIGYYNSAVVSLRNAIDLYPQSNHTEQMSYLIVSAAYEYARNSVEARQRERYLDMQDQYFSFISEYPESKYRSDAEEMYEESKKFLDRYSIENGEATEGTEGKSENAIESDLPPSLGLPSSLGM